MAQHNLRTVVGSGRPKPASVDVVTDAAGELDLTMHLPRVPASF